MRYIIAAAVGAVMSTGAAQAAVYQYDLTMGLESLSGSRLYGESFGGPPDPHIEGMECEPTGYPAPDITHDCEGRPNLAHAQFEPELVGGWTTSTISATFLLDTERNSEGREPGASPECSGSALICRHLSGDITEQFASPDGLRVATRDTGYDFVMTEDGLRYRNDSYFHFTLGNARYRTAGLLVADYTTTSFSVTEIAPIPLPASLPLLGIGLAAVGWVARRRRS